MGDAQVSKKFTTMFNPGVGLAATFDIGKKGDDSVYGWNAAFDVFVLEPVNPGDVSLSLRFGIGAMSIPRHVNVYTQQGSGMEECYGGLYCGDGAEVPVSDPNAAEPMSVEVHDLLLRGYVSPRLAVMLAKISYGDLLLTVSPDLNFEFYKKAYGKEFDKDFVLGLSADLSLAMENGFSILVGVKGDVIGTSPLVDNRTIAVTFSTAYHF